MSENAAVMAAFFSCKEIFMEVKAEAGGKGNGTSV